MKGLRPYVLSGAVLAGSVAFIWNGLLTTRAKNSLCKAVSTTAGFATQLMDSYMNPEGVRDRDEVADQANRDWVAYQWEKVGYPAKEE